MAPSLHWVGPRDAISIGRLLANTFESGEIGSRCRFSLKVLTTPHLTTDTRDVVVGLRPITWDKSMPSRLIGSILWSAFGVGRKLKKEGLPAGLRSQSNNAWRAMNFAASASASRMSVVFLARTTEAMAEHFGASIELQSSGSDRLVNAYIRHGFSPVAQNMAKNETFVRFPRAGVKRSTPRGWDSVLRTGRMTIERHEAYFGPIPSGSRVLDIGAGDSPITAQLNMSGIEAIACDPQYHNHPPANQRAVAAFGQNLPFGNDSFDEVYASFVLMHAPDPVAMLEEMIRVTQPGGRICIVPIWRIAQFSRANCGTSSLELVKGRLWPRRRGAMSLRITDGRIDSQLISAIARLSAPSPVVRFSSRLVMRALAFLRGTTTLNTGRLHLVHHSRKL